MNDIKITTTNDRQPWIALSRPLTEDQGEAPIIMPITLDSQHTTFPIIHDVPVRVLYEHYTLGMIIGYFPDIERVYLKYIIPRTYFSKIKDWENK